MSLNASMEWSEADRPLVSVIMNCYNGEKYLATAVESVIAQTYQNWELVFWDNQSSDSSAKIFRRFNDRRLKYHYAPSHTLLYEARNYAISKSSGQLLAFLDVDDWWVPEKLEKQVPRFDDPKVGIVCANYWIVNEARRSKREFLRTSVPEGYVLNELLESYFVGMLTLMLRSAAVAEMERQFDPRYHVIGDSDLVIRMAAKWKLACVREPIAHYRLHDSNESLHNKERELRELECWTRELGEIEGVRQQPGYSTRLNELEYFRGMLAASKGDRKEALRAWKSLPWGRYRMRLSIALLLPLVVLKAVRR